MVARSRLETPFAAYTLLSTTLHFAGETYYHVAIGQPFTAYLVDLISIALMTLAAISSLFRRSISSAGWLAAAWGFTLCLNYRSFFGRWRALQADGDQGLGEPSVVINILGVTLVLAAIAFVFSMYLARPQHSDGRD